MPQKLEWSPEYSVGVAKLDAQHKQLMKVNNALAECLEANDPESDSQFHIALNELSEYARTHFRAEEKMLKEAGYDRIADQYAEHEAFLQFLVEKTMEATKGRLDKLGLQRFVAGWWSYHILQSDMQYRDLLSLKTNL